MSANLVCTRADREWLERLQRWLYNEAADRNRRIRLSRLLADRRLLWAAVRRLRRARGQDSPGVDGVALGHLDRGGLVELVDGLLGDVQSQTYAPRQLRSAWIVEDGKKRHIRIPTVRDRIAQHALLLLLEPVVERELLPVAFGYRSGLGTPHAIQCVARALRKIPGAVYFVKADIKDCFDRIPLKNIDALLRSRVSGGAFWNVLLPQLRSWQARSGRGVPQGAPLSPLLVNLYLSVLDNVFASNREGSYFRYADDVLLLVAEGDGRPEETAEELVVALRSLDLEPKLEKLVVAPVEDGVEYLGVRIRRTSAGDVELDILPTSVAAVTETVYTALAEGADEEHLQELARSWAGGYQSIDDTLGQRARELVAQALGIHLPPCRDRRERTSGRHRKVPAWMRPGATADNGSDRSTQPRSGAGVQSRLRPGPSVTRSCRAVRYGDAVAGRTASQLGEDFDRSREWREYLGAELARAQKAIRETRTVRRRFYRHVEEALRQEQPDEVNSPDVVLQNSHEYRQLLASEHHHRARLRELERQVIDINAYIVAVRTEMFARGLDHGLILEAGREHLARVGTGTARRFY